jgi:hypothetical protein
MDHHPLWTCVQQRDQQMHAKHGSVGSSKEGMMLSPLLPPRPCTSLDSSTMQTNLLEASSTICVWHPHLITERARTTHCITSHFSRQQELILATFTDLLAQQGSSAALHHMQIGVHLISTIDGKVQLRHLIKSG